MPKGQCDRRITAATLRDQELELPLCGTTAAPGPEESRCQSATQFSMGNQPHNSSSQVMMAIDIFDEYCGQMGLNDVDTQMSF
jgi:hypothetical protein